MSDKFGMVGLESIENRYLDGRAVLNCADDTAAKIDEEVARRMKEFYERAVNIIKENREVLDKIAEYLIEKETITGKEFIKMYREIKEIPDPDEEKKEETSESEITENKDTVVERIVTVEEKKDETVLEVKE